MSADIHVKRNYCLLDGARHLAVRYFFILFEMPLLSFHNDGLSVSIWSR